MQNETDFQHNQINTNNPRESRVFADDKYVIKTPVATNPAHINVWLTKQQYSQSVINNLYKHSKASKEYFVPQIIEISTQDTPRVREERVTGKPVTKEFFNKLTSQQQEKIYDALVKFMHDMNRSYPVRDLSCLFEEPDNQGYTFQDILITLKHVVSDSDYTKIHRAYEFFKAHTEMTSSYVFFHGDMNENNIFYDSEQNIVSFIDFAESRYESAEYMFNHDIIKLPWININKLIAKYIKTNKNPVVRINSEHTMTNLFNSLRALQWTGEAIVKHPSKANIYKGILDKNIADIDLYYQRCTESLQLQYNALNTSRN